MWEYKLITKQLYPYGTDKELNELGADRWELIHIGSPKEWHTEEAMAVFIFKRPLRVEACERGK